MKQKKIVSTTLIPKGVKEDSGIKTTPWTVEISLSINQPIFMEKKPVKDIKITSPFRWW